MALWAARHFSRERLVRTDAQAQFMQHPVYFTSADYTEEMKTMEKLTLTLHKTKDTKHKVVYGTKDGDVIQSVYIDKDALGDVPPATLQVVISPQ